MSEMHKGLWPNNTLASHLFDHSHFAWPPSPPHPRVDSQWLRGHSEFAFSQRPTMNVLKSFSSPKCVLVATVKEQLAHRQKRAPVVLGQSKHNLSCELATGWQMQVSPQGIDRRAQKANQRTQAIFSPPNIRSSHAPRVPLMAIVGCLWAPFTSRPEHAPHAAKVTVVPNNLRQLLG